MSTALPSDMCFSAKRHRKRSLVSRPSLSLPRRARLDKLFVFIDIPIEALARFHAVSCDTGVTGCQFVLDRAREIAMFAPGSVASSPPIGYIVDSPRCTWITHFSNGVQVSLYGKHRSQFRRVPHQPHDGPGNAFMLKIESIEYVFEGYHDYISRSAVVVERIHRYAPSEPQADPQHSPTRARPQRKANNKRSQSATNHNNHDPASPSLEDGPPVFVTFETSRIPPLPVNGFGVTDGGMRCLEVSNHPFSVIVLCTYSWASRLRTMRCTCES
jgi:hypothetical protein